MRASRVESLSIKMNQQQPHIDYTLSSLVVIIAGALQAQRKAPACDPLLIEMIRTREIVCTKLKINCIQKLTAIRPLSGQNSAFRFLFSTEKMVYVRKTLLPINPITKRLHLNPYTYVFLP